MKVFMDDWYIAKQADAMGLTDKPIGLFFSHGGGGRVREPMEKMFSLLGKAVCDTVESKNTPDKKVLEACGQLGKKLAEAVI